MAISNIPRSVGHNFTPEYQISAIPYIKSFEDLTITRHIIRKSDGLEVGTVSDVNAVTTNSKIPDTDILKDNNNNNTIEEGEKVITNFKQNNNIDLFSVVKKVVLPKITNFIQIITKAHSVDIFFSFTDSANDTNKINVAANKETYPLRLRCVNLYLKDNAAITPELRAGLTVIDRKEFESVVEKFLGDNISPEVI
jgi:sporulation protein YlmC with PRC-barrel domain